MVAGARHLRTFLALPVPEPARRTLGEVIAPLRDSFRGVRFSSDEAAHLTVRFLGATAVDTAAKIADATRAILGVAPIEARFVGLGVFPERGAPRVLFVDVLPREAFDAAFGACERIAVEHGFTAERRRFRPHVTLGRWRSSSRRAPLPSFEHEIAVRFDRLVFYASELRPGGAVHTEVASCSLG